MFGREFYGTVLNAREFPLDTYLLCWHQLALLASARGHTLPDVVIADPTRVDLVTRAAVVPQHAASEAAWQKERHYSGRPRGQLHSYRHRDVRCVVVSNRFSV